MPKVLIVLTGSDVWTMKDGSTLPAGFWADEVTDPYNTFTAAGYAVELATPGGVPAPLQEYSLDESMTGSAQRTAQLRARLADLSGVLSAPRDLADVDPAQIDVVYIPGGTGPMEDLHADRELGRILAAVHRRGTIVAAACHGTVGLLSAREDDGAWLFAGYEMTAYSDEEERQGGPGDAAPFTPESRLRAEGAKYTAGAPWSQFVVQDRNLITGQNPASAAEVARQVVAHLPNL